MPKSAAKAFVSALTAKTALLVVDPASGSMKKALVEAVMASASAAGFMSSADFTKLAALRNPARALLVSGGLSRAGSSSYVLLDSAAWTEDLDTHGYFSQSSNGRFTYGNATTRTFLVRVIGQVSKSVAAEAVRIGLHKNGVDVGKDSSTAITTPPGASQSAALGLTTTVSLAQSDIVDIRVRSASGTNAIGANLMVEIEEVVS